MARHDMRAFTNQSCNSTRPTTKAKPCAEANNWRLMCQFVCWQWLSANTFKSRRLSWKKVADERHYYISHVHAFIGLVVKPLASTLKH